MANYLNTTARRNAFYPATLGGAGPAPADFYAAGESWEEDAPGRWDYATGPWATIADTRYSAGACRFLNNGIAGMALLNKPIYGSGLRFATNDMGNSAPIGARLELRVWSPDDSGAWAVAGEYTGYPPAVISFASGYYDVRVSNHSDPSRYTVLDNVTVL